MGVSGFVENGALLSIAELAVEGQGVHLSVESNTFQALVLSPLFDCFHQASPDPPLAERGQYGDTFGFGERANHPGPSGRHGTRRRLSEPVGRDRVMWVHFALRRKVLLLDEDTSPDRQAQRKVRWRGDGDRVSRRSFCDFHGGESVVGDREGVSFKGDFALGPSGAHLSGSGVGFGCPAS